MAAAASVGGPALCAVEIVVLDLILRSWPAIRFPVLVLGVWGLLFMLGATAGQIAHPHVVGPGGVRIRSGPLVEVAVPWDAVDRVVVRRHGLEGTAWVQVHDETDDGGVVSFPVQSTTTAEVVLARPLTLILPKGPVTARAVRFHADDTIALMAAVRTCLRPFEQRLTSSPTGRRRDAIRPDLPVRVGRSIPCGTPWQCRRRRRREPTMTPAAGP